MFSIALITNHNQFKVNFYGWGKSQPVQGVNLSVQIPHRGNTKNTKALCHSQTLQAEREPVLSNNGKERMLRPVVSCCSSPLSLLLSIKA